MQELGNLAIDHAPTAQAVSVDPDDIIIIRYDDPPTMEEAETAVVTARKFWPKNKVLITNKTVSIEKYSTARLHAILDRRKAAT
jgi:hypothetical protein